MRLTNNRFYALAQIRFHIEYWDYYAYSHCDSPSCLSSDQPATAVTTVRHVEALIFVRQPGQRAGHYWVISQED